MKALIKADWENAVLICAKCSKRLGGGFGRTGKKSLAKALRKQLGIKRFRKAPVGIVEVKCLGVCPRGAVTVVDASQPGEWRLVRPGADLDALAREIGLRA
ncbi:MAG: (2Fe-2S) ferredoxin domain-containing protein [Sphingomonas sp.]|uniref:(2Fe-2S) ferredoxin domain-containing protein n=1 Tax=Sphingomonas sp. TaxID=28214 RepID=UPI0035A9A3A7|nr:(2Fe-2S) ferredoxin domain-containing protein [Sphingomonas sp.]